jgi:hypothetical protein
LASGPSTATAQDLAKFRIPEMALIFRWLLLRSHE